MNDRIPHSQGDHVLVDVKAKPSGWAYGPALTPTPGAVRWQGAGRRPQGDRQIQVSTVPGDCRIGEIFDLPGCTAIAANGASRAFSQCSRPGGSPASTSNSSVLVVTQHVRERPIISIDTSAMTSTTPSCTIPHE
jgi:hypothetical protein